MEFTHEVHTFGPVYDKNSKILILGSFPSVKSRENQFYYGHPQNRFWRVIAAICNETLPETVEEKRVCCKGTASRSGMSLHPVILRAPLIAQSKT